MVMRFFGGTYAIPVVTKLKVRLLKATVSADKNEK
jgi:hypothetical protein|tara:strand:- start:15005 stop:15109 length:105 start_codon:yes stop_codon:yes gene_type:complete